jgi:hypothetical protein
LEPAADCGRITGKPEVIPADPIRAIVGSEEARLRRWPPSAAQTVRAGFPHTAFTKIQTSEMPEKELT